VRISKLLLLLRVVVAAVPGRHASLHPLESLGEALARLLHDVMLLIDLLETIAGGRHSVASRTRHIARLGLGSDRQSCAACGHYG